MRFLPPTAAQLVCHDFVSAEGAWPPATRAHVAFTLDTPIDRDRLADAVRQVVDAHDALRTTLEHRDGALVQVVREPAEITGSPCGTVDWDGTAAGVRRIVDAADVRNGPGAGPARVLTGAAGGRSLVVAVFDHVCVDGLSAELVAEQIRAAYDGTPPPMALSYTDYHARILDDASPAAHAAWDTVLARSRPAVPAWMLAARAAAPRARRGVHRWSFDPDSVALLTAAARRQRASPFEIVAAAVAVYFRRPDGAPAALGVVHGGRHRPGGAGVVGLVRGFVLHEGVVEAGATIADAVAARRDGLRGAFTDLTRLPWEEVCLRAGRPAGLRAGAPGAWEVELNVGFTAQEAGRMAGVAARSLDAAPPGEQWAENGGPLVALTFRLGPEAVTGNVRYTHPPVDHELAAALARELEATVRLIGTAPQTPAEAAPAFHELAGALAPAADTDLLHVLFGRAADRAPDAVALISGESTLTYAQLDARARALSRRLRARGAGPETAVAVRLGRSIDLVVAMLGVLMAGAVYVPIEPDTPGPRCRAMLHRAGARILVTRDDIHDPAITGPLPAVLDTGDPGAAVGDEAAGVRPDGLAYITFTSGSTGEPKAVGTTHASAVRYLRHLAASGYLRAGDTALQLATPSFDASIRDLLGPLTVGARVVLLADRSATDPAVWHAMIARHRVTVVPALAPATLRLLCDTHPGPAPGTLRLLMVSGEALPATTVRRARDSLGAAVDLVNHYGPTEATMTSTFHHVREAAPDPVPIGRPPVWGRIRLLDDALVPVAPGTVGEIYIGGPGVARGYVGDPGRSATRFLPDPSGAPGARMYRTGDRGRFDAQGILWFHGRVDAQLNLNGTRVEPGEIEAALRTHRSVREAAVGTIPGTTGGSVLVGYVAAHAGHTLEPAELRAFTASLLPDPLVPRAFRLVAALPRTARGKVDRAALAAHRTAARPADRPPRTEDEARMLALWREALRRPGFGVHDDLFEAGADSILVLSLVARIRRAFGRAPEPADIFRTPTVAEVTALLPPPGPRAPGPVPPARPEDAGPAPLCPAQQRLWFFEQLLPGTALNTITSAFLVEGRLDHAALAAATGDVIAHHDALRSTFDDDGGTPVRLPGGVDPTAFDVVPVDGDLAAAMNTVAARPLDHRRGPVLRVTAFAGPSGGGLLVRVHHLVADAGSLEMILDDLAAAYRARRAGAAPTLPPTTHSYADYVRWQSERLAGAPLDRELAFWRTELADAPSLLALPTDRDRPAVQRHRGAVHHRPIPADLAEAATALGRAGGASPFMVLAAVWAALLSRWTGQDDLVVGVPVSGRAEPEFDRVVGLFVNVLPVRVPLRGAPSTRAVLARLRAALFRAIDHGDLPFEQLVDHLRPQRSLAHGPVFQTLADTQRTPALDLPGARLTPTVVDTGGCWFDLSISFLRRDTGLTALLTYDTDLFDEDTVARLAAAFVRLLAAATAAPDHPIATLPLRSPAPLPRRSPTRYPAVADRIAENMRRFPDRVAVTAADRSVTYWALDHASAGIAARLRERGAGPGSLVGLCAEREPELVAGLLGILRAGAAYLPLDPTHPPERLGRLLAGARPELLLAQPALVDRLGDRAPRLVPLDPIATASTAPATPWTPCPAHELAYVVHTSGSTGDPKGVEVTRTGLAHLLGVLAERLGVTGADTLVAVTTVSFDIAALEMLLPLIVGARVVVASSADARDPARLRTLLRAARATVLQATPVTWQLLAEQPDPPRVRIGLCGGEALPPALAAGLRRMADSAFNVYGPTETTIWSTLAPVGEDDHVPLGDPLGDTVVHVLDAHLQPVLPGAIGEIYLGGPGVARGYRGQPGLTATRFLPDPFAGDGAARMYRTGDLGRHRDGRLDYLGRTDRQIKLRGFRIEPAETERALLDHAPVRAAVVAVRPDANGLAQLTAYLLADDELDIGRLRAFLGRRLPNHLVPTAITVLESFPLTANGKIDQRRLPRPATARPRPATRISRPGTGTERRLARVWQEVLGLEELGLDDDFFDLGGHSLSAIRLMAATAEEFGVRLELHSLFTERTPRRMAALIERVSSPGRG
ncbi:non-ribosomal peptide synthetase [Nocardia thailandica]|uniref:non-ribosomal peptide synthetase n=1 Tax=Nocardia thailandica TaxID=257275 RepID=UPI0003179384|nr:non-ribosomal peptide synthetase [Nocardia thailandica]